MGRSNVIISQLYIDLLTRVAVIMGIMKMNVVCPKVDSDDKDDDFGVWIVHDDEFDEIQRVQIHVKAILTSGQIRGHKYKYTNVIVSSILTSGQIRELHSSLVGFVALAVQLPSSLLT